MTATAFCLCSASAECILVLPCSTPNASACTTPYHCPRCRVGRTWLHCVIRGRVKVVGLADGPIIWPICRSGKGRARILTGDLVKAVRMESLVAVARLWGVSGQTVSVWRKVLNVPRFTRGTFKLYQEYGA